MTKEKYIDVKKNIEKELKKIIKDNRSHNGLERSEWQAVYSENISRGQLNRPLRTYYITTKAPSGRVFKIRNFFCTIFDSINVITH